MSAGGLPVTIARTGSCWHLAGASSMRHQLCQQLQGRGLAGGVRLPSMGWIAELVRSGQSRHKARGEGLSRASTEAQRDAASWPGELIWREFYTHMLWRSPRGHSEEFSRQAAWQAWTSMKRRSTRQSIRAVDTRSRYAQSIRAVEVRGGSECLGAGRDQGAAASRGASCSCRHESLEGQRRSSGPHAQWPEPGSQGGHS